MKCDYCKAHLDKNDMVTADGRKLHKNKQPGKSKSCIDRHNEIKEDNLLIAKVIRDSKKRK